jgi:hypothetical protein
MWLDRTYYMKLTLFCVGTGVEESREIWLQLEDDHWPLFSSEAESSFSVPSVCIYPYFTSHFTIAPICTWSYTRILYISILDWKFSQQRCIDITLTILQKFIKHMCLDVEADMPPLSSPTPPQTHLFSLSISLSLFKGKTVPRNCSKWTVHSLGQVYGFTVFIEAVKYTY